MPLPGPRLLVVDDNEKFAEVVEAAGTQRGYAVRCATDGKIAMQVCRDFKPEVIVLDVVMPEADGVEFINWHAASGQTAKLVVVSGVNPVYANLAAMIAKARGFTSVTVLDKPVRLKALFDAVSAGIQSDPALLGKPQVD